MDEAEKKRLEERGYWVGDYGDFLGLTDAERQHVELRIALSSAVKKLRADQGLTQRALGKLIDSTQSRVAKVETGTVEVSLDLMFRAFFALGGKLEDLSHPKAAEPVPAKAPTIKPKPRPKRLAKQS
jgi:DNA-binding XRE family transcriptional regulator